MHPFQINDKANFKVSEWGHPGIYLFEITNVKGMTLAISNYGAAVVSCIVPDKHGKHDDVVLGYGSLQEYMNDNFYIGTVVGRYANRIKDAQVNIAGDNFKLTAKPAGFHHHGGAQGFNKKMFAPRIFESEHEKGIVLSYMSADGEEGFPGNLHLTVTYTLDDENNWTIRYEAETDRPTILNLTQHSYFNLRGHGAGSIEDHDMQIMADKYLVVDDMFIPTGEIRNTGKSVFDFTSPLRLKTNIDAPEYAPGHGYDNSWVLETQHTASLKHAARASDRFSGRVLNVYTTEPSVHFYSGNFLDNGTEGKKGVTYNSRSGFCLETQHFPDSPHHPHFPTTVLLPGEKFISTTIFSFEVNG